MSTSLLAPPKPRAPPPPPPASSASSARPAAAITPNGATAVVAFEANGLTRPASSLIPASFPTTTTATARPSLTALAARAKPMSALPPPFSATAPRAPVSSPEKEKEKEAPPAARHPRVQENREAASKAEAKEQLARKEVLAAAATPPPPAASPVAATWGNKVTELANVLKAVHETREFIDPIKQAVAEVEDSAEARKALYKQLLADANEAIADAESLTENYRARLRKAEATKAPVDSLKTALLAMAVDERTFRARRNLIDWYLRARGLNSGQIIKLDPLDTEGPWPSPSMPFVVHRAKQCQELFDKIDPTNPATEKRFLSGVLDVVNNVLRLKPEKFDPEVFADAVLVQEDDYEVPESVMDEDEPKPNEKEEQEEPKVATLVIVDEDTEADDDDDTKKKKKKQQQKEKRKRLKKGFVVREEDMDMDIDADADETRPNAYLSDSEDEKEQVVNGKPSKAEKLAMARAAGLGPRATAELSEKMTKDKGTKRGRALSGVDFIDGEAQDVGDYESTSEITEEGEASGGDEEEEEEEEEDEEDSENNSKKKQKKTNKAEDGEEEEKTKKKKKERKRSKKQLAPATVQRQKKCNAAFVSLLATHLAFPLPRIHHIPRPASAKATTPTLEVFHVGLDLDLSSDEMSSAWSTQATPQHVSFVRGAVTKEGKPITKLVLFCAGKSSDHLEVTSQTRSKVIYTLMPDIQTQVVVYGNRGRKSASGGFVPLVSSALFDEWSVRVWKGHQKEDFAEQLQEFPTFLDYCKDKYPDEYAAALLKVETDYKHITTPEEEEEEKEKKPQKKEKDTTSAAAPPAKKKLKKDTTTTTTTTSMEDVIATIEEQWTAMAPDTKRWEPVALPLRGNTEKGLVTLKGAHLAWTEPAANAPASETNLMTRMGQGCEAVRIIRDVLELLDAPGDLAAKLAKAPVATQKAFPFLVLLGGSPVARGEYLRRLSVWLDDFKRAHTDPESIRPADLLRISTGLKPVT